MLLLQKNFSITTSTLTRIVSINLLNHKQLLATNHTTLSLYSLPHSELASQSHLHQWNTQSIMYSHQSTIIETHYHPYLTTVIVLVLSVQQGNKNWSIWHVKVDDSYLGQPQLIYQTAKNLTKYEGMQLKPKIIILPLKEYFIFVRQFYNDSQAIVFKGNEKTQQFYLNQECLSSYDDSHTLVSFRNIFKNKIMIQLFNISEVVKNGKNGNTINHRIQEYDETGVILAIKELCTNEMLIIFNEKEGKLKYLVYNSLKQEVIGSYVKENSRMLRFISLYNGKILSMQQSGNSTNLMIEQPNMNLKDKIEHKLIYEEWTISKGQRIPILCNYTQDIHQENIINISLIRMAEVQEARLALHKKFIDDDALIEEMLDLTR